MKTIRLTTSQALVKFLVAQRILINGHEEKLFPGVLAIFGHGNVTSLGVALDEERKNIRTWRGQNEQGMALAAVGFAKAKRRQQIMVASSSIGPGALNMVTAAGVAYVDRLPVLFLSGDTFVHRIPDPVLQQGESFSDPSITVNDAFKPVVRYWDRIVAPQQLLHSLPHAVSTMLDPATCGPAFIGLPQDVQAESFDFPEVFFEKVVHTIIRPRADATELKNAVEVLKNAKRPLIIAGGGVHYSLAEKELAAFATAHNIPVVETVAGKASLLASHPLNAGPVGVTGCESANNLAAQADVVVALGTRLQDFATGSWTIFSNEQTKFIGVNTVRFDAIKHRSLPVVGDAREALSDLGTQLGNWRSDDTWSKVAQQEVVAITNILTASLRKIKSQTRRNLQHMPKLLGLLIVLHSRAIMCSQQRVGSRVNLITAGGRRASIHLTANMGSRAWATNFLVRGAQKWRCQNAKLFLSSVMVHT